MKLPQTKLLINHEEVQSMQEAIERNGEIVTLVMDKNRQEQDAKILDEVSGHAQLWAYKARCVQVKPASETPSCSSLLFYCFLFKNGP